MLQIWRQGTHIIRCHESDFGATEFNPGLGRGRFHPFRDLAGKSVPTLYGADTLDGSLAETVFQNVPFRGDRAVPRSSLKAKMISVLAPRRDLKLVQLHGFGLRRLELTRTEIIESDSSQYERTADWARALHAWSEEVQGLIWVSRQHDTSLALILFGDRVARRDLEVVKVPLPLAKGAGLKRVRLAAELAGITMLE